MTDISLNNKRFEILDIAKGIGIFLVVFAHVNYTPFLLAYIYSFHMPIFFVFSGMLFNRDKYDNFLCFLKRRFKTLIYPYLLFYIASLIIMFPVHVISQGLSVDLIRDYGGYFLQMFISQGSQKVINSPLWFVPCLFAVEIMYYFISGICKKSKFFVILISLLTTFSGWLLESGILPFDNTLLPWSLDSAMFALGFYAIGNIFFDKIKIIINKIEQNKNKTTISFITVLLCFALIIPFVFVNGKISLGSKILNNGFLVYASGLIGTVGIMAAAILFKHNRLLKFCGLNTFCIMSTHFIIRVIYQAMTSFFGIMQYDSTSFFETVIPFVVVMTLSIIFCVIYNKIKKQINVKWG